MMPWTGKNWGAIAIPRIGQEVVISFEEGDPDRPMCIGMLYNDKTMPPYDLPDNKTQSGVKTNSSKGGLGFNELMFEDKKGEELVRFQAEKDFKQIVKNDADITIGKEKNEPGNMTLFVQNNQTETTVKHKKQTVGESYNLQIGNKTAHSDMMSSASKLISQLRFADSPSLGGALKMAYDSVIGAAAENKFNETVEGAHAHVVTLDHSQMIGAKHSHTVLGKFAQTIGLAHDHLVGVDYTQQIKRNHKQKGKNTKTVTKDMTTKVKQGDITIEAKMGQIDISAMKKIVLKVAGSSIELSPAGITIKGPMIQVNGQTMTEVKGGVSLILKGGLTMIN
jgi:phage baseplate assembly protein gpV